MGHKTRPFTRKQRHAALRRRLQEEADVRKARRVETKQFHQNLDIFKGCDPERIERLADGD